VNLGIVVESDRDGGVYSELIKHIRPEIVNVYARACGDVVNLKRSFVGWLKYFEYAPGFIQKAIVIRDSDCADPTALEAQLHERYVQSGFTASFPVHFHATKCELETWLLADEMAITEVSQRRGRARQCATITIELESHKNAKELFRGVLSRVDLPADPAVYREIASFADISRIAARCAHFRQFVEKVRAV
jgi:hypothetical protein